MVMSKKFTLFSFDPNVAEVSLVLSERLSSPIIRPIGERKHVDPLKTCRQAQMKMLLRLTCIPSANQSIQLIVTSTPNPSITAMERFALRIDNKIAKIGG